MFSEKTKQQNKKDHNKNLGHQFDLKMRRTGANKINATPHFCIVYFLQQDKQNLTTINC